MSGIAGRRAGDSSRPTVDGRGPRYMTAVLMQTHAGVSSLGLFAVGQLHELHTSDRQLGWVCGERGMAGKG